MASWSTSTPLPILLGLLSILLLHPLTTTFGIRLGIIHRSSPDLPIFREAPSFKNGEQCGSENADGIHVAMTLDANYIRGTMAAVFSLLQHSTCPENLYFHFLSAHIAPEFFSSMKSTFPYLNFKTYAFDSNRTLVVVDDIAKLWSVDMEDKVVAAPEYCQANFTQYFTHKFWSDPYLSKTFQGRNPCYFNTGVMVVDVDKWRKGGYTQKVEEWMALQKRKRLYNLGSLPPFLLVLAGNIKAVDHRWNQHGLGGDNFEGECRSLHPGPISLLHWSGKGKPWLRLDSRKPCTVDHLWAPYDLYHSSRHFLEE
ncbi:hypothetical protein GBA52_003871 [Prunus armeniaca]|nr:hypothetical protein GBA52_003871 [Prunus armeniaca]